MKQILTIDQVSDHLVIAKSTAYKLSREGVLPGFKVGKHWRFLVADIEAYVEQQREAN